MRRLFAFLLLCCGGISAQIVKGTAFTAVQNTAATSISITATGTAAANSLDLATITLDDTGTGTSSCASISGTNAQTWSRLGAAIRVSSEEVQEIWIAFSTAGFTSSTVIANCSTTSGTITGAMVVQSYTGTNASAGNASAGIGNTADQSQALATISSASVSVPTSSHANSIYVGVVAIDRNITTTDTMTAGTGFTIDGTAQDSCCMTASLETKSAVVNPPANTTVNITFTSRSQSATLRGIEILALQVGVVPDFGFKGETGIKGKVGWK